MNQDQNSGPSRIDIAKAAIRLGRMIKLFGCYVLINIIAIGIVFCKEGLTLAEIEVDSMILNGLDMFFYAFCYVWTLYYIIVAFVLMAQVSSLMKSVWLKFLFGIYILWIIFTIVAVIGGENEAVEIILLFGNLPFIIYIVSLQKQLKKLGLASGLLGIPKDRIARYSQGDD